MSEMLEGQFVRSLAGHDKGMVYVILKIDQSRVFVTDGALRSVSRPKAKNAKRLRPIHCMAASVLNRAATEPPRTDEEVKRAIKLYCTEHCNQK